MSKQRRTKQQTTPEQTPPQVPQSGVQVVLVLNGQQAGGQFLPLPETYAQAEQGLQTVFTSLRDTLARLYEERVRQIATAEKQRADALADELAALQAELAALKGDTT